MRISTNFFNSNLKTPNLVGGAHTAAKCQKGQTSTNRAHQHKRARTNPKFVLEQLAKKTRINTPKHVRAHTHTRLLSRG